MEYVYIMLSKEKEAEIKELDKILDTYKTSHPEVEFIHEYNGGNVTRVKCITKEFGANWYRHIRNGINFITMILPCGKITVVEEPNKMHLFKQMLVDSESNVIDSELGKKLYGINY